MPFRYILVCLDSIFDVDTGGQVMTIYGAYQDSGNGSYNSPPVTPPSAPESAIRRKDPTEAPALAQVALGEVYDLLRDQTRRHPPAPSDSVTGQ
jgi:hypothetical protein